MSKHTPEPWEACNSGGADVIYAKDSIGADRRIAEMIGPDCEANAARIAACVNACKGINPEAVPDLLAALREYLERHEASCEPRGLPEYEKARAAIAKAEGKT